MQKKSVIKFLALSVLLAIILVSPDFAKAAVGDDPTSSSTVVADRITEVIDSFQAVASPIFRALLGQTEGPSGMLFTKILAFLLVMFIIMAVVANVSLFQGKDWLQFLVSALVSLIGTRFLPNEILEAMTLPSSALVAVLVLGIPFFIFGYILLKVTKNPLIRKMGWVVFAIIIGILWLYNISKPWNMIYLVFVLGCIMALFFDHKLKRLLGKAQARTTMEEITQVQRLRILAEIKDLEQTLSSASPTERSKITKDINNRKSALKTL